MVKRVKVSLMVEGVEFGNYQCIKGAGVEYGYQGKGVGGEECCQIKGVGEAEPHGRRKSVLCITVFIYECTRHGGFLLLYMYKDKHNSFQ